MTASPVKPRPLPFNSILGLVNVSLAIVLGVGLFFYLVDPDASLITDPWTVGTGTLTTAATILYARDYFDWFAERWCLPLPRVTGGVLFATTWLAIWTARRLLETAYGIAIK